MDDDTAELIQALCVRAGMIMEDASVEALVWSEEEREDPGPKLLRLSGTTMLLRHLVTAARALSSPNSPRLMPGNG